MRLAMAIFIGVTSSHCFADNEEASTGAAQGLAEKDIAAKSLPLRTALHHDPSLKAPLDQLLTLYRGAGRLDELMGVYASHVAQFPNDQNALTVLIRLKAATGDPESLRDARNATNRFSDNAYLHYILHELLARRHEPEAIDQLDKAIQLQTHPNRRLAWIDQLLAAATRTDRRDLAKKHLLTLATEAATAETQLELARKMVKFQFYELALQQLARPSDASAGPETMVAIQLEAAAAEVGLDQMAKASKRLDELLDNLTADYWQREEINRRRLALIGSQSERESLIASRQKLVDKNPNDEAAILDLAQILGGLQRRREALSLLLDAGRRLPRSEQIEKRTLEMFDRLRDERGRAEYLAQRLTKYPKRHDLALMHIKTQFHLGRRAEGKVAVKQLFASLDGDQRMGTMLEMARYLRRSTLLSDAAEVYRELVQSAPDRLDIRRELAETYLAMGQRGRVRSLFAGDASQSASLENLLDMVQFMIQQELLSEARMLLRQRLTVEEGNFDLQLLLLSISQKLGDFRTGEKLIVEARAVADTAARYRQWLEAAVAFHEAFESTPGFLDAELMRLEGDAAKWTARRLERRLAFSDVASENKQLELALALLERDIDEELPAEFRVKIRRQLVAVLEREPARIGDLQEQLTLLSEEDQRYADESKARLALLHVRMQRHDLSTQLLDKINLTNIHDPTLLTALENLYRQHGRHKEVLVILGRLTQLNPTDRANWQRWLTVLAGTGDERRLRGALRQLLAGVNKLPLTDEAKLLLENHLADSFWRSIARSMAGGNNAATAEALVLLDAVERMAQDDQHWLWLNWIRAHALNQLGREQERDEAIGELERIVAIVYKPDDDSKPDDFRIALPDGLTVDLRHARRLLNSAPADPIAIHAAPGDPPLPPLKVRWSFDIDAGSPVQSILPTTNGRLLISAANGSVSCVDGKTGKLLWHESGILPAPPTAARQQHHHYAAMQASWGMSRPLCDEDGMIYVPMPMAVACHDTSNGHLVWRASVGATGNANPAAGGSLVSIFFHRGQLLTYEPASGTIAKVDRKTGKVVWDKQLLVEAEARRPVSVSWQNSGASLSGDRLMVYGARSAILDVTTGRVLCSFEPWRVRNFPVKLDDPAEAKKKPEPASGTQAGQTVNPSLQITYQQLVSMQSRSGSLFSGRVSRGGWSYQPQRAGLLQIQPTQYIDYIAAHGAHVSVQSAAPKFRMGLTSPAVVWAASIYQGQMRQAHLTTRHLLLRSNNGIQILSTDLPLSAKQLSVQGNLIGSVGRHVVFSNGSVVHVVDGVGGTVKQLPIAATPNTSTVPNQVTMHGALVYHSSQAGIQCFNTLTAQRVFQCEWPEDLIPEPEPQATDQKATMLHQLARARFGHHYLRSGISYPVGYNVAAAAYVSPEAACIDDGVLYTLVSRSRVVALEGAGADGH